MLLAQDPLTVLEGANVLPYQNEQLIDKKLMMYLETHPSYQGKHVREDVFKQWKILLFKMLYVLVRGYSVHFFAMRINYPDQEVFSIEKCLSTWACVPEYQKMLRRVESEDL